MADKQPVLLIEDDRVDAMTVRRALRELGATNQVIQTTNGEQALEYLRNQDNQLPCLILMDLNTPRMTGMEFLRIIAADESFRNIPVVVMSTSNEPREVDEISRLGACRYIVKSVDYRQFVEEFRAIEQLWNSAEFAADTSSGPVKPY
ncbi:MAG: response regulator [Sedimentisphaerales bacterium]|nr:response regulator [Sedimentisphaerales bacterium]